MKIRLMLCALALTALAGSATASNFENPDRVQQHIISGAARFNYIGRFRTPACPHCGEMLTVNGRPMTPSDFKGKRFKCRSCRTPLSCFTRRHRDP